MISLMILFYSIVCPFIFVYGIGLERLFIQTEENFKTCCIFSIKSLSIIFICASIMWPLKNYVLNAIGLSFLIPPLAAVLLYGAELLCKKFIPFFSVCNTNENLFIFASLFFSLYEASSYAEVTALIISSGISFIFFTVVLKAIKYKIESFHRFSKWKKASLFLISLSFILCSLYFIDTSPFFYIYL